MTYERPEITELGTIASITAIVGNNVTGDVFPDANGGFPICNQSGDDLCLFDDGSEDVTLPPVG